MKVINLNLPAVPHVSMRILKILDDPYVSLKKLEELILADHSLSAKILKIANSAFYGLRRKVTLISEAINVIGFKTIKDVILVASIREVYRVFGLIEKKLWEHGVGVSLAGGIISEYIQIIKREEMTLAGLIHDIGKIVINNNFPSEYVKCMNLVHLSNRNFIDVEKEVLGFTHQEVGALLADKWGFSNELKVVIAYHNDLEYIRNTEDIYERTFLLGINLADSICTRLGIGYKEPMPNLVKNEEAIMSMLGLTQINYSDIVNKFIDMFPQYLENFIE